MQIKAVLTKSESVTKSGRETSLYNCAFSLSIFSKNVGGVVLIK